MVDWFVSEIQVATDLVIEDPLVTFIGLKFFVGQNVHFEACHSTICWPDNAFNVEVGKKYASISFLLNSCGRSIPKNCSS